VISPSFVPVTTNLHSFLHVRGIISQFSYLSSVLGLRDALSAYLHIATVRTRVIPCEFILPAAYLISNALLWMNQQELITLIKGDKRKNAALFDDSRVTFSKEGRLGTKKVQTFLKTLSTVLGGIPWPLR
jgi:hypothetical protein